MVTTVRQDGYADGIKKTLNNYIRKYHSQNLTTDSSGDCKTQKQCLELLLSLILWY